jgi:hypothetical protein
MEITRKSFISSTATGLAAVGLLSGRALAESPYTLAEGPTLLRRAVGETFYAVGVGGNMVPLELVRSDDVRSDALTDQYSLYFTPDPRYTLAQGTWSLVSTSGMRVRDVFLVTAGTNAAGDRLYRADFCLLREAAPSPPRP